MADWMLQSPTVPLVDQICKCTVYSLSTHSHQRFFHTFTQFDMQTALQYLTLVDLSSAQYKHDMEIMTEVVSLNFFGCFN